MATPPGVGKTSAREAIAFSHADGQVGFPPAISTAASSGHSVMAYQSPEIIWKGKSVTWRGFKETRFVVTDGLKKS